MGTKAALYGSLISLRKASYAKHSLGRGVAPKIPSMYKMSLKSQHKAFNKKHF